MSSQAPAASPPVLIGNASRLALSLPLFGTFFSVLVLSVTFSRLHPVVNHVVTQYQVHIALGEQPNEIAVQWTTLDPDHGPLTQNSMVFYGFSRTSLQFSANGTQWVFTDGGDSQRSVTQHLVYLRDLMPHTTYYYIVGDPEVGFSPILRLHTLPERVGENGRPLRVGVWGDLGVVNSVSLPRIASYVEQSRWDLAIHIGDMAYNMDNDNGKNGDAFMNMVQPVASRIPYMVCMGNHESAYNFSHYSNRFALMPRHLGQSYNNSSPSNWYYSFNIGPVHFISVSSELAFFAPELIEQQYRWLERDLQNVDRDQTPWIIMFAHRPMYCSCDSDCDTDAEILRTGPSFDGAFGLERLCHDYGVDLYLCGHEHNYERMWPVYDKRAQYYPLSAPYVNPRATVHIVSGSAGCAEEIEEFIRGIGSFSAFHSATYGFGQITVYNATHLHWEQIFDGDGSVLDEVWLIQERHGSFNASEEMQLSSLDTGTQRSPKLQSLSELHQPPVSYFHSYDVPKPVPVALETQGGTCPDIQKCDDSNGQCQCLQRKGKSCVWGPCSQL